MVCFPQQLPSGGVIPQSKKRTTFEKNVCVAHFNYPALHTPKAIDLFTLVSTLFVVLSILQVRAAEALDCDSPHKIKTKQCFVPVCRHQRDHQGLQEGGQGEGRRLGGETRWKTKKKRRNAGSFSHSSRTPRKPGARTGGSTLRAAGGATTRRGSRGSSPRG